MMLICLHQTDKRRKYWIKSRMQWRNWFAKRISQRLGAD